MIQMERHLKPMKELSLIPLINVVFLLLIFFMVAGSLERFDVLSVDPPVAESGEELTQGFIVIVLGRHKEVLLNDELVTTSEITPWLKQQLKEHKDRVVTIKADSRLSAVDVIDVIEIIRGAGAKHLTIQTQEL